MIRDALHKEDDTLRENLPDEQSMYDAALDIFRSKSRWMAISFIAAMVILTVAAVPMIVRFFQATEMREMMIWGGGFMICVAAGIGLKIWSWVVMTKHAIMREIKRVELQLAQVGAVLARLEDADLGGS